MAAADGLTRGMVVGMSPKLATPIPDPPHGEMPGRRRRSSGRHEPAGIDPWSILRGLPCGVLLVEVTSGDNPRAEVLWVNRAGRRLLGLEGSAVGRSLDDVWSECASSLVAPLLGQILDEGRTVEWQSVLPRSTADAVARVRATDSGAGRVALVIEDVTERQRTLRELLESERRLLLMTQVAFEGIAVCEGGRILMANAALGRMFARPAVGMIGAALSDLLAAGGSDSDAQGPAPGAIDALAGAGRRTIRVLGQRADGSSFPVRLRGRRAEYDGRPVDVFAFQDISDREHSRQLQREQRRLERAALTDKLTGLYNRHHFDQAIKRELGRSRRLQLPVALLLLDIDHFKAINDLHGHPVGDRVLQSLAKTLIVSRRASDLIARYGGEEFAIVLPDTDLTGAVEVAERVRAAACLLRVGAPLGKVNVSVSVGVACCPQHGTSLQRLVAAADAALYRAKRDGRNCVRPADPPAPR